MPNHSDISSQTRVDLPHTMENVTIQLKEIYEVNNILSGGVETLNDDLQRLATDSIRYQTALDPLTQDLSILKTSVQEQNTFLDGMKMNQDLLQQEIASIQEKVSDMKTRSFDGTFIWKISNVQEKIGQQLRNIVFYLDK
jgi:predicted  nucleic acid-binding Zn-ribbon protein